MKIQMGRSYRCRNGQTAKLITQYSKKPILFEGDLEGSQKLWYQDGRHRFSVSDYDIIEEISPLEESIKKGLAWLETWHPGAIDKLNGLNGFDETGEKGILEQIFPGSCEVYSILSMKWCIEHGFISNSGNTKGFMKSWRRALENRGKKTYKIGDLCPGDKIRTHEGVVTVIRGSQNYFINEQFKIVDKSEVYGKLESF